MFCYSSFRTEKGSKDRGRLRVMI